MRSELTEGQRIDNLNAALASARKQMWDQSSRADRAEERCRELERAHVHPALAIDVQEHRTEAYQAGWNDGYAEGHAVGRALAQENRNG